MDDTPERPSVSDVPVDLDRDVFLRQLLRELAGTLEGVVGLDDASGFISIVGRTVGQQIDRDHREALGVERLDREQVAEVLVDLKRRIDGDVRIVSVDAERIVLRNRRCPFGEKVSDRLSLCMMTSNVVGSIAADNLGYAQVELLETLAAGDGGCHVVLHLRPSAGADDGGREYFGPD